jgi:hypothetical protein
VNISRRKTYDKFKKRKNPNYLNKLEEKILKSKKVLHQRVREGCIIREEDQNRKGSSHQYAAKILIRK